MNVSRPFSCWSIYYCFILFFSGVSCSYNNPIYDSSYAYVLVKNTINGDEKTFCCNYQQWQQQKIARSPEDTKGLKIGWWAEKPRNYDVCDEEDDRNLNGRFVPVQYHSNSTKSFRCPHAGKRDFTPLIWYEQIEQIEDTNASAGMFLMHRGLQYFKNSRDFLFSDWRNPYMNNSYIPFFYTYHKTFNEMLKLSKRTDNNDLEFYFYRFSTLPLDPALVIMFSMAIFSIAVGGYWSGKRRLELWSDEMNRERQRKEVKRLRRIERSQNAATAEQQSDSSGQHTKKIHQKQEEIEPSAAPCTWLTLIVMVIAVVGMLLLAYFFRSVIVWFIIVLFVIGSSIACYNCTSALFNFPCGRCQVCASLNDMSKSVIRRELCQWQWCHARPMWRNVVLFCASCALAIIWCIFRKWPYAFILQDILSVNFCIHFLKSLRFPNLKYLTILLLVMLVYDLVMVFITPYLTKDGCSIMVQVATGQTGCAPPNPNSYPIAPIDTTRPEIIPILLRIPRLSDPMLPCYDLSVEVEFKPFMLGLGDIILPGFLISFCFGMDFLWGIPYHIYGIAATISYGIGMIVTFMALYLMEQAQPALIYLIPFTLITIFVVAAIRKEVGKLWRGDTPKDDYLERLPIVEETREQNAPLATADYQSTSDSPDHAEQKPEDITDRSHSFDEI